MNHGRLFQSVATKNRRDDAGDGVGVCGGVGEERKKYDPTNRNGNGFKYCILSFDVMHDDFDGVRNETRNQRLQSDLRLRFNY